MLFNISEVLERVLYYQTMWNKGELHLCEKLTIEAVKGEGKCIYNNVKLNTKNVEKTYQNKFHWSRPSALHVLPRNSAAKG